MRDDGRRRPSRPDDRQDVISDEAWNGGEGKISFNYLQQREVDKTESPETPLEQAGGTDIWNISGE
jgi:hypothetical protein